MHQDNYSLKMEDIHKVPNNTHHHRNTCQTVGRLDAEKQQYSIGAELVGIESEVSSLFLLRLSCY